VRGSPNKREMASKGMGSHLTIKQFVSDPRVTPRNLACQAAVQQQVRWLDRVRFRRAIRQAVPGLLQQGAAGETLLSVLAASLYFSPSPSTMDHDGVIVREAAEACISSSARTARCFFALTSHNLHVFPFLSPTITTFVPDQILPLWRINRGLQTIEIPFFPADALPLRGTADSPDPLPHLKALILRVDPRDWLAANLFWSAGLAAAAHWGDLATIARHLETATQNVRK